MKEYEDDKKRRKLIKKICQTHNIPCSEDFIIILTENNIKHIYSCVFDWGRNEVEDNMIKSQMESLGEPLVFDEYGNPTNDVIWHFRKNRTNFSKNSPNVGEPFYEILNKESWSITTFDILNILRMKGYTEGIDEWV